MSLRERVGRWWRVVRELALDTFHSWSSHRIALRAAAMSYYFLVTLAPLVLVFLYVVSRVLGSADPASLLPAADISQSGVDALVQVVGVARTYAEQMGTSGPLISAGIALVGATALLGNFSAALDWIWESAPQRGGVRYFVRKRLLGVAGLFVILIGALCLALFVAVVKVALGAIEQLVEGVVTLPGSLNIVANLSWLIGLAFVTLLLSAAFTWLPRRPIRWADTLPGSLLTAGAYAIGQRALGVYFDHSAIISAWGALGSFVALVVWIYYTMQVVLGGAELTRQLVLRAEERTATTSLSR